MIAVEKLYNYYLNVNKEVIEATEEFKTINHLQLIGTAKKKVPIVSFVLVTPGHALHLCFLPP